MKLAAIGDLHMSEDGRGSLRETFMQMSADAEAAVFCGDLTNHGTPLEAENLAADLSELRIPAIAVLGNHDYHSNKAEELKRILSEKGMQFLEDHPRHIGEVGFAGTKGFGGGFANYMLGSFGEEPIKRFVAEAVNESLHLENSLHELEGLKKIVVLHYSPISETVEGESPQIFPFMGSSRLADTIDKFQVSLVMHGHAHHGTFSGRTPGNVPVYNCAIDVVMKAEARPYAILDV